MTIASVRQFFSQHAPDIDILELGQSTATVDLAAQAHGVAPGQIAKTLSLRVGQEVVLVVACGDTRLDNKKLRHALGGRPKMLPPDEVASLTGHPVGGVCPFGLVQPLPVYCDVQLRDYDIVMPAAGSLDSAVRISPQRLVELTGATWVDVCQTQPCDANS
ncbi:YbaK/EbsC family protein [Castellaniella sp.]|uniref:YbaK/EbsC family protein n=1 Tax=Castellaniella sp. TaxID=1955812 RepID=UPI002AFEAB4E|nr:YbaK/EbsC family protein [Castellaniella sp.]